MLEHLLFFGLLSIASPEQNAQDWAYDDGSVQTLAGRRIRYNSRATVWVANYDRPSRACVPPEPGVSGFCPSNDSDEVGFGAGIEVLFRAIGPVYLTVGIDFLFSSPEFDTLKKQFIVAAPFGILFTWYEWLVRPIAQATITPVLLITDDTRDFTLGGNGGLAVRILRFGSLSFTAGYQWSRPVRTWQVQLALHPL